MSVTVGYAQYEVSFGDWDGNRCLVESSVAEAGAVDLLVLPELGLSGYDFPDRDTLEELAEPFKSGPTSELLRELAAEHKTTLVCGYPERADEGFYNSALLALPDGGLRNYRKIHLFSREKELFLPGDAPPPVFETPAGRVGVMICFDWFFPETARCLALAGAQIIAHPSNLVLPWCQRAMFTRSIENRVFTITANRIGTETQAGRELVFTGASQVLNTLGETLAQAPLDAPHVATALIEPVEADNKQATPVNHLLEDRRPELYGRLMHDA